MNEIQMSDLSLSIVTHTSDKKFDGQVLATFLQETAQRIAAMDRESEGAEYTDTDGVWQLLHEIQAQCQAFGAALSTPASGELRERLADLKAQGLSFGDCLAVFGHRAETHPYVAAAFNRYADETGVSLDEYAVVSESEEGAFVSAWLWVDSPGCDLQARFGEQGEHPLYTRDAYTRNPPPKPDPDYWNWVWLQIRAQGDVPVPELRALGYRVLSQDAEEERFAWIYEDLATHCRDVSDMLFDTEQAAWDDACRNAVAAQLLLSGTRQEQT